ncbi:MAG: hypothetical protein WEC59_09825 [Salibacteraceae bacterium]
MTIADRYKQKPLLFLVKVIEHAPDFQPEAVEAAKREIQSRKVDRADILKAARQVITEDIDAYLDSFSVVNDKLKLPKSFFLNEEEVKLVFQTCFVRWKEESDDMIPDSWLYVLGAGFG